MECDTIVPLNVVSVPCVTRCAPRRSWCPEVAMFAVGEGLLGRKRWLEEERRREGEEERGARKRGT